MTPKPKCIIVTGRPGSGKTTLAKQLGERLWFPVVSRDEIKEGYVNTFGVRHDQLPPEVNALVTEFFFDVVNRYLAAQLSVIIEAAFQHPVWASRMPQIRELSCPWMIVCSFDDELAARRHLQRGLDQPRREFYHGDKRVTYFRATGEFLPPPPFQLPAFDVPTIQVSTAGAYDPSLDAIVQQIETSVTD